MEQPKHELIAEKIKFKHFFYLEYLLFNLVGIDFSCEQRILRRPWVTWPTGACLLFIMIGSCHYSATHISDLDVAADAMAKFVQCALGCWKCIIIVYKRKDMMNLLLRIWNLVDLATEVDLKSIVKENKAHWRLSGIYCGNVLVTAVSAAILPLLIDNFGYFRKENFEPQAPLTASYPLDLKKPFNYLIVYIINLLGMHFVVFNTIAIDSLYSWGIHNIVGQFKVLQEKFKALNISSHVDASGSMDCYKNADVRNSIIHCIKYHQQTIVLAEQLNKTFRPIVFVEFTLNSTQLCFIVYQIGRGLDISAMPFLFSFMFTILVQLLLYSYGGQHLENESEKVAIMVYKSIQWQFWSTRERKMLLLSILRAQRPLKMTAIFFDVNMRIFVSVIQTSASYVTLLWSVGRN